jgi:hypothetical protein
VRINGIVGSPRRSVIGTSTPSIAALGVDTDATSRFDILGLHGQRCIDHHHNRGALAWHVDLGLRPCEGRGKGDQTQQ